VSARENPVLIEGPAGSLEALHLDHPDAHGMAIICHPHPLFDGTMHNKVISTLQRTVRDEGYSTLRFNFRGVGQSVGTYGEGAGEIEDAYAAAWWFIKQHPGLPLTVMGFSFGACVAGRLAGRLEHEALPLTRLFMLAPSVERFDVEGKLPVSCPLTIIQPEADEVVTPDKVYAWAEGLAQEHELIKVPECSHFFHGKLTDLKALVQSRLG
jgi:alpha/beta superfamily hydrolase